MFKSKWVQVLILAIIIYVGVSGPGVVRAAVQGLEGQTSGTDVILRMYRPNPSTVSFVAVFPDGEEFEISRHTLPHARLVRNYDALQELEQLEMRLAVINTVISDLEMENMELTIQISGLYAELALLGEDEGLRRNLESRLRFLERNFSRNQRTILSLESKELIEIQAGIQEIIALGLKGGR